MFLCDLPEEILLFDIFRFFIDLSYLSLCKQINKYYKSLVEQIIIQYESISLPNNLIKCISDGYRNISLSCAKNILTGYVVNVHYSEYYNYHHSPGDEYSTIKLILSNGKIINAYFNKKSYKCIINGYKGITGHNIIEYNNYIINIAKNTNYFSIKTRSLDAKYCKLI